MKKIVNLTPHAINIVGADGQVVRTIAPSGVSARLKATTVPVGDVDGIPTSKTVFGDGQDIPAADDADTLYIVSQLIKSAYPTQSNLCVPADVVRDADGRIVGCRSLGV
jgi:hypothetical protein